MDDSDLLAGPVPDLVSHRGPSAPPAWKPRRWPWGRPARPCRLWSSWPPDRVELAEPLEVLCENWATLWGQLIAQAKGEPDAVSSDQIRTQANALVLRSTQAYLTARKGTGFLRTEPAQRWARQALFFLVWSCPAPVAQAAIRDLAGLCQV